MSETPLDPSTMSRRRQMIAELHRELHAEDAAAAEPQAKA